MQRFSCTLSPFPSPSPSSSSCSAAAAASPAASGVACSTYHSAEVAARLPSAATAAAAPSAAAAVKPFDRELFRAFISAASRLFCDDEQIVVIDFLAHHEKAFTERELSDRLRWGERRVREACAALERLMLIAKEHMLPSGSAAPRKVESQNENGAVFALHQQQDAHGGGGGGQQQPGTSAPSYYRVSPFCFLVFQYRLQRMEQHVEMQRRNAESRDVFFCPACRTQYDALEAQLLDVHPQDAHFLCKFCNERLEHEDSRLLLQQVTSLQERCEKQLQVLKTLVRRGWNMQIPTFPPFTRAEKNQQKLKSSEEEEKHRKGVFALHGDNLNGHSEDPFLKQQQAGGMLPDGSRSAAHAQPSWVIGAPGRRREEGMAAADIPAAGGPGADGKFSVAVYTDGGSGEWNQLLNNKGATAASQAEASGRLQQQSRVGAVTGAAATAPGGRNQIKFAMKSSGVGGKPASVLGSRLRAAHAVQHSGAAASSPDKTRGKASAPAAACAAAPAEPAGSSAPAVTGVAGSAAAAAGDGRRESDSTVTSGAQSGVSAPDAVKQAAGAALQHAPQQQQEILDEDKREKEQHQLDAAVPDTAAAAASVHREELSAAAAADIDEGAPLLYVSRMGREMTLEEAAEYQQEMTAEEHEKFMELQAMYLDEI